MFMNTSVFESISPSRACLSGSITTPAHVLSAGHSLTLVRPLDALSPQIRSAMRSQSVLPAVQINTVDGTVTLVNAKIVNVGPPFPRPKSGDTHEIEQVELTFQKITITRRHGNKNSSDDWQLHG